MHGAVLYPCSSSETLSPIPRPAKELTRLCAAEDDGYLMTYVHDETTGESDLVVYDAKTMSSTPVARVPLPHRSAVFPIVSQKGHVFLAVRDCLLAGGLVLIVLKW
jgi:hypothetical protein